MPAHIRIRILLVLAVAVICGGLFVVTEAQREGDEASFGEYQSVRGLRDAAMQMVIAFNEASAHDDREGGAMRTADRVLQRAIEDVAVRGFGHAASERRLLAEQVDLARRLWHSQRRRLPPTNRLSQQRPLQAQVG